MKKLIKNTVFFAIMLIVGFCMCACDFSDDSGCKVVEEIKLETVVLNEVEFKNGEDINLTQKCDEIEIGGSVNAMSAAQKNVFGVDDVNHVFALNITFDKERTLSYFEIKGNKTKVYSTNSEDENYVGTLTDLLDNESGEDAYCGLILSADTKNYVLTTKYSDGYTSVVNIKVSATLVSA